MTQLNIFTRHILGICAQAPHELGWILINKETYSQIAFTLEYPYNTFAKEVMSFC